MRKYLMTLAAVLCCTMAMAVFSACSSDNNDNLVHSVDGRIVGK